jgi:hypothetical protein
LIILTVLILLLAFGAVFVLAQSAGISVRELVVDIVVYVMYAILMLAYLLRFALVFLGVFAAYRLLRERYGRRVAV